MDLLVIALVVVAAHTVQTAIGFGAMVIAVTVGAVWWPVAELLPVLVPVTWLQNLWVAWRYRGEVDGGLLGRRVLPLMGAGLAVGLAVAAREPPRLEPLLGVLVLSLALRELWAGPPRGAGVVVWPSHVGMVLSGVVHGLFATGGPPMVWALARLGLEKSALRSTLTVVWAVANTALVIVFASSGRFDLERATQSVALLPAAAVGVWLGGVVHDRVDADRFRVAVWVGVAVAAAALLR